MEGKAKKELGQKGEDFAVELLTQEGLILVKRNYRCPKGEIDIIGWDKKVLVFVEVRTRRTGQKGWGEESITATKQRRLRQVASYYILEAGYKDWPSIRFDVVALQWSENTPKSLWIRGI